jgi:hypothetical protein
MKNIPALCVDNFYSDPDRIREWALSLDFIDVEDKTSPGLRTQMLHLIDRDFFDEFCKKLFSIFFDLENTDIKYRVQTSFQLVESMSPDPNSPKNQGWVHFDTNTIFAGVIFLTPEIDLNCGTSIFKLVEPNKLDMSNAKIDFYRNGIDNDYDRRITEHRQAYIETIKFNNVYNRLICFDTECAHGVNSFYSTTEPRLTQVFFVEEINTDIPPPIVRHQKYL